MPKRRAPRGRRGGGNASKRGAKTAAKVEIDEGFEKDVDMGDGNGQEVVMPCEAVSDSKLEDSQEEIGVEDVSVDGDGKGQVDVMSCEAVSDSKLEDSQEEIGVEDVSVDDDVSLTEMTSLTTVFLDAEKEVVINDEVKKTNLEEPAKEDCESVDLVEDISPSTEQSRCIAVDDDNVIENPSDEADRTFKNNSSESFHKGVNEVISELDHASGSASEYSKNKEETEGVEEKQTETKIDAIVREEDGVDKENLYSTDTISDKETELDEGLEVISVQEEWQEADETSTKEISDEEIQYVDEEAEDDEDQLMALMNEGSKGEKEEEGMKKQKSFKLDDEESGDKFEEISEGSIDQAEQEDELNNSFSDVEITGETFEPKTNKPSNKVTQQKTCKTTLSLEEVFFVTENDDGKVVVEDKDNEYISDASLPEQEDSNLSLEEISDDDVDVSKKKRKSLDANNIKKEKSTTINAPEVSNNNEVEEEKIQSNNPEKAEDDKGSEKPDSKKRQANFDSNVADGTPRKQPKISPEKAIDDGDEAVFQTNICPVKKVEPKEPQTVRATRTASTVSKLKPVNSACQTERRNMKGKIVQCNINPVKASAPSISVDEFAVGSSQISSQFLEKFKDQFPPSIPRSVIASLTSFQFYTGTYTLCLGPITFADIDSAAFRENLFRKTDRFSIVFDENRQGVFKALIKKQEDVALFVRELRGFNLGNRYMTLSLVYGQEDTLTLKGVVTLMYEQDIQCRRDPPSKGDAKLRAKLQLANVPQSVSKDFVHLLFPEALSISSGPVFDKSRSMTLGFTSTKLAEDIIQCYEFVVINDCQLKTTALDYVPSSASATSIGFQEESGTVVVLDEASVDSQSQDDVEMTDMTGQTELIISSSEETCAEVGSERNKQIIEQQAEEENVEKVIVQEDLLERKSSVICEDAIVTEDSDTTNTEIVASAVEVNASTEIEESKGNTPDGKVCDDQSTKSSGDVEQTQQISDTVDAIPSTSISNDESTTTISNVVSEAIVLDMIEDLINSTEFKDILEEDARENNSTQGNTCESREENNISDEKNSSSEGLTATFDSKNVTEGEQNDTDIKDTDIVMTVAVTEKVASADQEQVAEKLTPSNKDENNAKSEVEDELKSKDEEKEKVLDGEKVETVTVSGKDPTSSKILEDVSDEEIAQQENKENNTQSDVVVLREDSHTNVLASIDLTLEDSEIDKMSEKSKTLNKDTVVNTKADTDEKDSSQSEKQKNEPVQWTDGDFTVDMEVIDVEEDVDQTEKILYARSTTPDKARRSRQMAQMAKFVGPILPNPQARFPPPFRPDMYRPMQPNHRAHAYQSWSQQPRKGPEPPMQFPPGRPHPYQESHNRYQPRSQPWHQMPPYQPAEGPDSRSRDRGNQSQSRRDRDSYRHRSPINSQSRSRYPEQRRHSPRQQERKRSSSRRNEPRRPSPHYSSRRRSSSRHREHKRSPPRHQPRKRSRSRTLSDMSTDSGHKPLPPRHMSNSKREGREILSRKISRSPISASRSRSLSPVSRSPSPPHGILRQKEEIVKSVKQFLHAAQEIRQARVDNVRQARGDNVSSVSKSPLRFDSSSVSRQRRQSKSPDNGSRNRQMKTYRHSRSPHQRQQRNRSPSPRQRAQRYPPKEELRKPSPRSSYRRRHSRSPVSYRPHRSPSPVSYRPHRSPSPVSSESNSPLPPPSMSGKRKEYQEVSQLTSRRGYEENTRRRRSRESPSTSKTVYHSERDHEGSTWREQQKIKLSQVASADTHSRQYTHQPVAHVIPAQISSMPVPTISSTYSYPPPIVPPSIPHPSHYQYNPPPAPYTAHTAYPENAYPQPYAAAPAQQHPQPVESNVQLEAYQQAFSIIQTALASHEAAPSQLQQAAAPPPSSRNKSWSMGNNALVFQRILGNEGKHMK